jgi:hypothetical protein
LMAISNSLKGRHKFNFCKSSYRNSKGIQVRASSSGVQIGLMRLKVF